MNTHNHSVGNPTRKRIAPEGMLKATGIILLTCLLAQGQASASVPCPATQTTRAAKADATSPGYLKVFSATEESQWGEGSYYYLHTGYRIYGSDGKVVKWVENHDSRSDETPSQVELPAGCYVIEARSETRGMVSIPVVVKLGQTTALHLDGGKTATSSAHAVTTASGKVVGWKA